MPRRPVAPVEVDEMGSILLIDGRGFSRNRNRWLASKIAGDLAGR
jgi:hypothetical protein